MTHNGSTDIAILAGVIAARAIVEHGEPNTIVSQHASPSRRTITRILS